jgi:hypothetical protein
MPAYQSAAVPEATVSGELAYLGRHAWVSFKRTVGLSQNSDRTYYVERFARGLQSGALPRSYAVMATGKNDGAGSQAQADMSALCFAAAFGLDYVHRPFTVIEHAEFGMDDWVRQCERHFNLGAGSRVLGEPPGPVVPIEELVTAPETWPRNAIVAAPHYLHYCNEDPQAWERVRPLLRDRFWKNKSPRAAEPFTIALHMRRGDVTADNKKVANNFTPNAAFLRTLDSIRTAVAARVPDARIKLFSQGDPGIFAEFVAAGCGLHLDEPALDTHAQLVAADVLISSKGAFSYTAGVLNDGITLYDPQKYRPLDDWIIRAADGSFDEAAFARRLDATVQRAGG